AVSGGEVSVAARAVAPGRLVAALIYAIGDVSGAHLNPAVSLAFTLKRLFPVRWLVPYDWEWTDELLVDAQRRLASWSAWALRGRSAGTTGILDELRVALMHDLDTPAAVAAVDARAAGGSASAEGDLAEIDALLGIRL
ncbi:MAG: aquaporin, partial [Chloroflexota bacterium]|nr:aquaporin [Chloroflexota bacterium]